VELLTGAREAYTLRQRLTTFPLISRLPKVWACRPERSSYSVRADKPSVAAGSVCVTVLSSG
jgi:hypothetical protein